MVQPGQTELEVDWDPWFRREFADVPDIEVASVIANHPDRLEANLTGLGLDTNDEVARVFVVGHGGHSGEANPEGILIHSHLNDIRVVAGRTPSPKAKSASAFRPLAGKFTPNAQIYLHACSLSPSDPGLACAVGRAWADALGLEKGALFIAYTYTLSSILFVTKPFWLYAPRLRAAAGTFQLATVSYVASAIHNPELTHRPLFWAVPLVYLAVRASLHLIFDRGFAVTFEGRTDAPHLRKVHAWEFRHLFAKSCAGNL